MREPRKPDPLEPAEAVLRFLSSVASDSEAEFYLRLFRSRARESFATIAASAASLEHGVDGVAMDMRFLSELELTPVVGLGLDEPARAREHAADLAERLQDDGYDATPLAIGEPC